MALTNRLGVVNWTLENDLITLCASLENQMKLEDDTGMGFFEFVSQLDSGTVNPLTLFSKLFYYLQVGTSYTPDEIYRCFFADIGLYGESFGDQQTKLINHLLGQKEAAIINDASKNEDNKGKS